MFARFAGYHFENIIAVIKYYSIYEDFKKM